MYVKSANSTATGTRSSWRVTTPVAALPPHLHVHAIGNLARSTVVIRAKSISVAEEECKSTQALRACDIHTVLIQTSLYLKHYAAQCSSPTNETPGSAVSSPSTTGCSPASRSAEQVCSLADDGTTRTIPMPLLNVRAISCGSI